MEEKTFREMFMERLDDGTVPENILTVGRLIKYMLGFKANAPVKIVNRSKEMKVTFVGCSPDDEGAWIGREIANDKEAHWFKITC